MTVAELDGSGIAEQYALLIKLNPEAFDQLMQMRMVIETAVTAAAASARTADDLAALRASIEATRQASEDENYQAAIDADLTFHSAVARATQNPFLVLVMNPVNEALRETYREPQGYLASQPETAAEHEAIYEAILSQDPEAAGEAAQTHIRRVIAGRDRFLGE
ncbi:FadR/GntR family transcriptional regulator [Streptomyces sp. NPDC059477]|uniref:FadR/GntR family transcriptional regulator n=1 Tax=Streptomyces sp. NPDC059477 TaxID=3346847 RepID=UPI00369650A7